VGIEGLREAIEKVDVSTTAAKLRQLMPQIEQKIAQGVQHQALVDALCKAGLEVNLNTFRKTLARYRQRQKPGGQRAVEAPLASAGASAEPPQAEEAPEQVADRYMRRRRSILRDPKEAKK